MHRVRVDFNAMTDQRIVAGRCILGECAGISIGDTVIVFDDDTDDYDAVVVDTRGRTLLLKVYGPAQPE